MAVMSIEDNAVRHLREEQSRLLEAWQTAAEQELPHLEAQIREAEGPLRVAMSHLLALMARYLESCAEASSPQRSHFQSVAPLLQEYALEIATLPVAWEEACRLVALLCVQGRAALSAYESESPLLSLCEGLEAAVLACAAEHRIAQSEQELARLREESIITQHLAGRFLANASHELRTPLTAVLGFAELLLEETYGPLTGQQVVAIGHIENSAQNLLEIVNNLLDLLHIRAGKLTMHYRTVGISRLLNDLYTILLPLAQRKGVRFEIGVPDDAGVMEADDNIVRHIVYHLLSSALRATPEEGLVTLSAHRTETAMVIEVRDTALHLPPEAIANMMESFPRLENSPARGYEGWEVGLPLVRRYVELHQGELVMHSLPQTGTIFAVHLPLSRSSTPALSHL